jgi:poly-gamma-glutamate synthesis protein (capsule biosynthesis protein)
VLPHLAVLRSAATAAGHDFGPLLAPSRPWVAGADLALCHLEVPIAPDGTEPTGYPAFGAPRELAAGLAAQGWDGCSTASNHSLDRGVAGVATTLDALDAAGLGHVGTARGPVEAAAPQLYRLERAGRTVTVAHLAATQELNGGGPPGDATWSVTLLDPADLVARAAAARAEGADVVVVSVHCCVEYVTAPAARQVEVAGALAASGVVDVVLGHHAHVPQPIELLPGGPAGAGMWVFHGLGNFLSNQDAACCVPGTSSGVLATVEVVVPGDGPARVDAVGWTATTVDRGGGHRVHALADVAGGTATLSPAEVAARVAGVARATGTQAAARTVPPRPTGPPPVVVPRPR